MYRPRTTKEGTIMQTNIRFDLQPKQRPKLAEEIATALRAIPCYQKVPSMVFVITKKIRNNFDPLSLR